MIVRRYDCKIFVNFTEDTGVKVASQSEIDIVASVKFRKLFCLYVSGSLNDLYTIVCCITGIARDYINN